MKLFGIFILICITNFFLPTVSIAQKVKLAGKVTDMNGIAIANATVSIIDIKTASITSYTITNKDGIFTVSVDSSDTGIISISCIGYAKHEKPIIYEFQTYILEEKQTLLPTVEVKNSPVSLQGDTTNYTASFFSSKQDRVIGDVLAKLPGIEMDANGLITYNGKPISNYYIDGLDLLGTKYNIANNNIPAELVDKIQILNNHQAIKALDSFTTDKSSAINIKLKSKAKNRLLKKAKLGIGASPLLWDNELTALNFRNNLQLIGAYKNNNSGSYLYNELNDNVTIRQLGEENDNAANTKLLNLVNLTPPNLPAKRYTFNNSHLLHFNIVTILKNKAQLKLNVSQYFDRNFFNGSAATSFYLPNDTTNFKEVYSNNNKENKFKTELTYTINTKKYYLSNLLTYRNEHSTERGQIENPRLVLQKLPSNNDYISNEFILNKVKRNTLLSISSKLEYSIIPQQLDVSPGTFTEVFNRGADFPELQQKTGLKNLITNNSISITAKRNFFQYESKWGLETSGLNLQSYFLNPADNTIPLTTDSITNNLSWQRIKPYLFNVASLVKKERKMIITLPIEGNFATQENNSTLRKKHYNNIFINPRLDLTIPFTSLIEFQFGLVKQATVKSILDTYSGYILTNYRTLRQNDSILPLEKLTNLRAVFAYKNPLKGLFFYFTSSYSILKKNLLLSNIYTNSLTKTLAIQKWNNQYSLYFTGYLNKFFLNAKTNLSIIFVNGKINNLQLLQNTEARISVIKNEIKLKVTVNKFSWGNFENSLSLQKNKSRIFQEQAKISDIQNFTIQGSSKIYYFLGKRISTSVNADYYNFTDSQTAHSNYFFLDLGLRYKFNNVDIEAAITNIANNKVFSAELITKNVNQEYNYKIRPANATLKLYFSF